jgi:hypothetical protein
MSAGFTHSSSLQVDGPRRTMSAGVSIGLTAPMFGFRIRNPCVERISGSDSGYSPAPTCVQPRPVASWPGIGRQLYG